MIRLYEAGAVLLIIGAVILGPIDGRGLVPLPDRKCTDGAVHMEPPCYRMETTAETCVRAMKEMGARRTNFRVIDDPDADWAIKGQPVLCIPAPTGLRR